ncbi:MAG: glycosyltransferase family 39 protein [Armatimonadetes bacterium]|nr:glycosyltransferase family 39 protein [Armatimonadota bacterium]
MNSASRRKSLPQKLFLVLLLLFSIMIVCCFSATLDWQMGWDTAPIHYTAWRILQGDRLYEDVFDVSWPASPLVHMLSIAVFGKTDVGFRLFDLVWVCFLNATMFIFLRKPRWKAAAAASLCFCACYLAAGETNMQEREIQMLPFLILTLHFTGLSIERKRSLYAFLAGFFLGFVTFIKPFPVALLAMLLVYLVVAFVQSGDAKALPAVVASLCGGFLIPGVLILLWLYQMNAVQSFWQLVVFIHYRLYRSLYNGTPAVILGRFALWTLPAWPVLISVVRVKRMDLRMQLALIGAAYGLIHYFIQSKGWSQHIYIVVTFFLVTGFSAVDIVLQGPNPRWRYAAVVLTGITLLLLSPLYLINLERLKKKNLEYVESAMNDLRPLVKTGDEVQPIENMAGLINAIYRLNLRIPARYLHSYPFFHATGNQKDDFIARLSSDRVQVIIIDGDDVALIHHEYPALEELLEKDCYRYQSNELYSIYLKKRKGKD